MNALPRPFGNAGLTGGQHTGKNVIVKILAEHAACKERWNERFRDWTYDGDHDDATAYAFDSCGALRATRRVPVLADTVLVAIISTSGAVIVSTVAILQNNKRFDDISRRFDDINRRLDDMNGHLGSRLDRLERSIEVIQSDLKEFYRDLTRLKHHTGLD